MQVPVDVLLSLWLLSRVVSGLQRNLCGKKQFCHLSFIKRRSRQNFPATYCMEKLE